jgi:hypothetical protein
MNFCRSTQRRCSAVRRAVPDLDEKFSMMILKIMSAGLNDQRDMSLPDKECEDDTTSQ